MNTPTNRKNFPITNIGSVTLMMIFIVLCMITFAALSLSSAASDHRSAEKAVSHIQSYYKASGKAEETLAGIDQVLADCYRKTSDANGYYKEILAHYKNDPDITINQKNNTFTFTYLTKISEKQSLKSCLTIPYPSEGNKRYQITSWKTVTTAEWNGDNSLPLLEK